MPWILKILNQNGWIHAVLFIQYYCFERHISWLEQVLCTRCVVNIGKNPTEWSSCDIHIDHSTDSPDWKATEASLSFDLHIYRHACPLFAGPSFGRAVHARILLIERLIHPLFFLLCPPLSAMLSAVTVKWIFSEYNYAAVSMRAV